MSLKKAVMAALKKKFQELDTDNPAAVDTLTVQRAEDLMSILGNSLVPLDYVAELAHMHAADLKVWTDYDLIPSVKMEDKVFISGKKVIHMLEDEEHPLRLNDPSVLPLTPDLALKRLIKAQDV